MTLSRLRRLAIPVILTALTACDNVRWEGVDVRLEPPPTAEDTTAGEPVEPETDRPPPLSVGPVLYAVQRDDPETVLFAVARIGEDGDLQPLPADTVEDFASRFTRQRMGPGTRFTLYGSGVKAGTFHAVGPVPPDTVLCQPRPRVRGVLEVVPSAAETDRFLALETDGEPASPPGNFRPRAHTRSERVASLNVAAGLLNELQAPWPTDLVDARADIQVFRPGGPGDTSGDSPAIAATFLFRDQLALVSAPDPAWSIFFLAESLPEEGYRSTYVEYRTVGGEGKGAPRFWEHADWDGDGRDEVLLEVLGEDRRWFAALDRGAGAWSRTFEDPCGRPS